MYTAPILACSLASRRAENVIADESADPGVHTAPAPPWRQVSSPQHGPLLGDKVPEQLPGLLPLRGWSRHLALRILDGIEAIQGSCCLSCGYVAGT